MNFDRVLWQNTLAEWLIFLGLWALLWLVFSLARRASIRLLESLHVRGGGVRGALELIIAGLKSLRMEILGVLAFTSALQRLELSPKVELWTARVSVTALLLQVGLILDAVIREAYVKRLKSEHRSAVAFGLFGFLLRMLAWILVSLILLDNLGVEITALVAGLGVGGVAIALAVQNILGDLFASLTIALDRPFEVGDFIVVENFMGTVARVGIKTTRLISLSGEELIFGNGDLLKSRLRNFKRMRERRVEMALKVVYNTPSEKLARVNEIVKAAIGRQPGLRFEYCRLKTLGLYALEFEVVYWVLSADYNLYLEVQEKINLEILERFRAEEIRFALNVFTSA